MSGRPSGFTQEIADTICERIADGESLRSICAADDMPNKATVFKWLAAFPTFSDQYARARETQADSLFDDVLTIADSSQDDPQDRRVRIDARKWMAGKLRPKVYGDKIAIGGDRDMDPIKTEEVGQGIATLRAMISGIAERTGKAGESPAE